MYLKGQDFELVTPLFPSPDVNTLLASYRTTQFKTPISSTGYDEDTLHARGKEH